MTSRAGHGHAMMANGHEFAGADGRKAARVGWHDIADDCFSDWTAGKYRDDVREELARLRIMASRGERVTAWRE